MAITISSNNFLRYGTPEFSVYCKAVILKNFNGKILFRVDCYYDKVASETVDVNSMIEFQFQIAGNSLTDAYAYIKTLDNFRGWVDV